MRKTLRRMQKHKNGRKVLWSVGVLGLAGIFLAPSIISASNNCSFTTSGSTMTLNGSCITDETILVPDHMTLDGGGYTITAVDPAGGHFKGAVVKNGGPIANVMNVNISTMGLANVCDGGNDRLRGIMFEGASGTIAGNGIVDLNQGASGCQEGNAIEVRNAPFDNTGTDTSVVIANNVILNYQKTGIVANGSVAVDVRNNIVAGVGPVDYIAQNGIQIGFGGTATIQENSIRGNDYTPKSDISCGILLFAADGVRSSENKFGRNEMNFCNFGQRSGGQYKPSTD